MTKRTRARRDARRPQSAVLSLPQVRWLGALLIAVQLPQTAHVPLWVACLGIALVGVRLALAGRAEFEGRLGGMRAVPWLLAIFAVAAGFAIRQSFGYFLGRDPCVAFLFVLATTYVSKRFTHDQATRAIVTSYYWHFVDVVWIALFFMIYILK